MADEELLNGLQSLITQQTAIIDQQRQMLSQIGDIVGNLKTGVSRGQMTPSPVNIYQHSANQIPASPDPYDSDFIEWAWGPDLSIHIWSQLDRVVTVEVVGNLTNSIFTSENINGPIAIFANSNRAIIVDREDWRPFVWCRVRVPLSPSQGIINITYNIKS
ncbi:MAG: hypothetical protein PHI12_06930 [Dehalococcoidales bacterium]|nr:hypothetical protein [Dehalococcoidales bacterium]